MAETILPYLRAFLVGGLFCVIAQILIDKTKLTPARILVFYVVAGVILVPLASTSHWWTLQAQAPLPP